MPTHVARERGVQLAALLSQAGHEPESVQTTAVVHLDKDDGTCPVSRALGAIEIGLDAKLA
jgi:hypothetical protein